MTDPNLTRRHSRGTVQLFQADALAILAQLPDGLVDLVLTDPPYSSGGLYRGDRASQSTRQKYQFTNARLVHPEFSGDNRDQRGWGYWSALWLAEARRVTRRGGVVAMFADWRQLATATDAIQAGGWVFRGIVPWDKTEAARPHQGRYRSQCEFVVWGSNGPMEHAGPCLPGLVRAAVNARTKIHAAEKPLAIMRDLARIAWRPEAVILDPFMGSGTTGLAAIEHGAGFLGIECDRTIYEQAAGRIVEALDRMEAAAPCSN
jgi:site-specific DNA-methyltransferase (adenine-specific)